MGLAVSEPAIGLMERYAVELALWNRRMNLTAIESPEDVVRKHFLDSLSCLKVVPPAEGERLLDVGSGAGFPGLVLKIARPDLRLALLDSVGKRMEFLKHVAGELGLVGVEFCHGRAEEWGRRPGFREAFDTVTARAVARMPILVELCLPFVRPGGRFVAFKGREAGKELEEAGEAIGLLGGSERGTVRVQLPGGQEDRHLVIIDKTARTPEAFPRRVGVPEKRPLTGRGAPGGRAAGKRPYAP